MLFGLEEFGAVDFGAGQGELQGRVQCEQAVGRAAFEVDRARVVVVAHGHRDLGDLESEKGRLHQELRVEDEVVGVAFPGDRFEHLARVGAVAGVPFGEVLSGEHVLGQGQEAVGEVLPPGHAAGHGVEAHAAHVDLD